MKYIQTEIDNLVRDPTTNALLNKDMSALNAYKIQRARALEVEGLKARDAEREARIERMENDIDHIKVALNAIAEKLNVNNRS